MENKLQQLTEKLYNEGLTKGKEQGETMVAQAKEEAAKIIAEATAQAAQIVQDAQKAATELKSNTENEIRMASSQAMSSLRQQIERMVLTEVVTPQVSAAWKDGKFIKDLALTAVAAFRPTAQEPLQLVVPVAMQKEIAAVVAEKFAKGVDVVTDAKVKVPFRIIPQAAGYHINFTDSDFDTLFKAYLRPRVVELLFETGK